MFESDMPTRVLCMPGLKMRNQMTTIATEATVQVSSCAVRPREGATSTISETSKAPSPNQTMKNAGTASSAMISPMPSTAQCHHSGCMPASMFIYPVPPDVCPAASKYPPPYQD
ncbi:MAG: hypothetical protein A2Z44_09925 [Betaproteobacteria bacterium RBG_19FT_COMBO_58_11]|nr:MAG: hypothetical protein A2Z44_09925 [Betaproteobacteria bacterium RBG_19FT_COMBO_58_11]